MSEIDNLISFRGLKQGFQATPLRHFKGTFDGFTTRLVEKMTPPATEVNLSFSDVEVIKSTEPYPFPIAQIQILFGGEKSQWGTFSRSGLKFLKENEDIKNLVGKILELEYTPNHMMWTKKEGKEVARECWEIISVVESGKPITTPGSIDITQSRASAIKALEGKTEKEWNQQVFQDTTIKSDSGLLGIIIKKEFIPALLAAGTITKDTDERFHVVK